MRKGQDSNLQPHRGDGFQNRLTAAVHLSEQITWKLYKKQFRSLKFFQISYIIEKQYASQVQLQQAALDPYNQTIYH